MFQLCEAMKWNHLPLGGGIYDQDPDLLDGFLIIWFERSKFEEEERKREEQKSKRGQNNPRVAGRRH